MKKLNRKGFTIVELVIVIAVIAILAAVMIPTFSSVVQNAKESAALQEIRIAYTETLAKVLGDDDTTNDTIATDTVVVAASNGIVVTITNGEAEVAATGTAATYELQTDGTLKKK